MLWYMYTEDCYLAMKRKKCESVELRWMNLCLLHTVVFYLLSLDSVLQGHVHKVTHVHNFLIETQKHQYPTFNGIRCIQGLAQHLTHSWAITMFYLFAHSGSHSLIQRPVFGKSLLWYPLTGWHFQQLHQLVHPLILLCPSERARGEAEKSKQGIPVCLPSFPPPVPSCLLPDAPVLQGSSVQSCSQTWAFFQAFHCCCVALYASIFCSYSSMSSSSNSLISAWISASYASSSAFWSTFSLKIIYNTLGVSWN